MDITKIQEIAKAGENETTEFKEDIPLTSTLGKLISAFANGKGGRIIVGFSSKEEIIGYPIEQLDRLRMRINLVTRRKLIPTLKGVKRDTTIIPNTSKCVTVITIPEGKEKPYGFRGRYFKREGTQISEIERESLIEFLGGVKVAERATMTEVLKKLTSIERFLEDSTKTLRSSNIFISHGKNKKVLEKVERFLESLDLNPIVVKEESSEGLSVDDKVEKYIKTSECAIVIFTPDDKLQDGTCVPRQNVIHETGLLQREKPDKIIYLKEESVSLPSNIMPKVYAKFKDKNLTEAFIQIVRELKTFELI